MRFQLFCAWSTTGEGSFSLKIKIVNERNFDRSAFKNLECLENIFDNLISEKFEAKEAFLSDFFLSKNEEIEFKVACIA